MLEIHTLVKILAFVMFVIATYKSAKYYKNRAKIYEDELENEMSRHARREKAIEHIENLENREKCYV